MGHVCHRRVRRRTAPPVAPQLCQRRLDADRRAGGVPNLVQRKTLSRAVRDGSASVQGGSDPDHDGPGWPLAAAPSCCLVLANCSTHAPALTTYPQWCSLGAAAPLRVPAAAALRRSRTAFMHAGDVSTAPCARVRIRFSVCTTQSPGTRYVRFASNNRNACDPPRWAEPRETAKLLVTRAVLSSSCGRLRGPPVATGCVSRQLVWVGVLLGHRGPNGVSGAMLGLLLRVGPSQPHDQRPKCIHEMRCHHVPVGLRWLRAGAKRSAGPRVLGRCVVVRRPRDMERAPPRRHATWKSNCACQCCERKYMRGAHMLSSSCIHASQLSSAFVVHVSRCPTSQ